MTMLRIGFPSDQVGIFLKTSEITPVTARGPTLIRQDEVPNKCHSATARLERQADLPRDRPIPHRLGGKYGHNVSSFGARWIVSRAHPLPLQHFVISNTFAIKALLQRSSERRRTCVPDD